MWRAFVTAIIALTSGSAMASSIEHIQGTRAGNNSFTQLECSGCRPLKERAQVETHSVPSIVPGTQQGEIREIDGQRAMVRTEAWLGGAPVTFVSKNPAWLPLEDTITAVAGHDETLPATPAAETISTGEAGIDASATTAAIQSDTAPSAPAAAAPDFSGFKLRTD